MTYHQSGTVYSMTCDHRPQRCKRKVVISVPKGTKDGDAYSTVWDNAKAWSDRDGQHFCPAH